MRNLTRTDRDAIIAIAIATVVALLLRQDPPRELEPAPLQPVEGWEAKPTEIRFGETFEDLRVARPKKIGGVETWVGEDGRTYSLRYMGIGIRELPEDALIPTDEEFELWLDSDNPDLDAFLHELRGGSEADDG